MDNLFGNDLFGEPINQTMKGKLSETFLVPPFSTLSTRDGWWQERKDAWGTLGIKGEVGRKNDLLFGAFNKDYLSKYTKGGMDFEAVSIFDPVLCETMYSWFCPLGGQIVDPFAGGSVRGIVAHCLQRKYWGADLRQEQIDANNEQGKLLTPDNPPVWVCGDSAEVLDQAPEADFIFSCPPYGDLEKYSDDPKDLSNMEYWQFMEAMFRIIQKCFKRLKDDRFAAFIVGDFRDSDGNYRNFPGETITMFQSAGFKFYNEAILLNVIGTAAIRATRQFNGGRKLVKCHQNILVFVKGSGKKATEYLKSKNPQEAQNGEIDGSADQGSGGQIYKDGGILAPSEKAGGEAEKGTGGSQGEGSGGGVPGPEAAGGAGVGGGSQGQLFG